MRGWLVGVTVFVAVVSGARAEEVQVPQLPERFAQRMAEVYATLKQAYVDEVDDEQLLQDAVSGMVGGLDPHSTYLDYTKMQDNGVPNKGPFGGLGIEVAMESDQVRVVAPIEDTPAFAAGLRAGDLIVAIDGLPVKGLDLGQAILRMRGEPGTTVRLSVLRKGLAAPHEFSLVRAVIQNPSVKVRRAESGYLHVRITQFRDATGRDLAEALKVAGDGNSAPIKGAVLDLRDNPGGSLVASLAVASTFLAPDALIVTTEGREPATRARFIANPDQYVEGGAENDYLREVPQALRTLPLVVLVNGGSASAAEIVAGALQDHGRAKVVGMQTYGKGTIQTLFPLSTGSALKLTVARYFTPSGRSIQQMGVMPDVLVDEQAGRRPLDPLPARGTDADLPFRRAIALLKGSGVQ